MYVCVCWGSSRLGEKAEETAIVSTQASDVTCYVLPSLGTSFFNIYMKNIWAYFDIFLFTGGEREGDMQDSNLGPCVGASALAVYTLIQ